MASYGSYFLWHIKKEGIAIYEKELNLLSSVIRNTAIAVSYMDNKYEFGRIAPVKYCLGKFPEKLTFSIEEYIILYHYRLEFSRNLDDLTGDLTNEGYVYYWLNNARVLLDTAIEMIEKEGLS